ncbi:MAG: hypothetical protein WCD77_20495, partial [Acidobacteriaceae bacterium]
ERVLMPTEIHSISRIFLLLYLYIFSSNERTTSWNEGLGDQGKKFRKHADMGKMTGEICICERAGRGCLVIADLSEKVHGPALSTARRG